jgi:hypothetical protein
MLVMLVGGAAILHSGPSTPADGAELSYRSFPNDVAVVIHADVRGLVGSELYRSLSDRLGDTPFPSNAQYQEFVEATGFRFETDLTSISLGVGGDLEGDSPPFYMLVDGNFDRKKIDTYIRNSGEYDSAELDGLTVFVPNAAADGQDFKATLAWLDDDTLLVGSSADFGKLARSIDGRAPNAADSELSRLVAGARGQVRLAMTFPEAEPRDPGEATTPSMVHSIVEAVRSSPLGQLQSIMLTLNAGSGLDVTLQAKADTPANGSAVYEMLNGYMAMGRMMAAENPELGVFLDHLTLEREESAVSLAISMTGDEIRAAIEESQSQEVVAEPDGG